MMARLKIGDRTGFLRDGIYEEPFRRTLLAAISKRIRIKGRSGELSAYPGPSLRRILPSGELPLEASVLLKAEQSNTSVIYGNSLYLKLYRRLEEGLNPDMEVVRFLSEKRAFPNIPPFAGAIEYRKPGSEPMVIGLLQGCVAHQGDAWRYTLDELNRYIERVLSKNEDLPVIPDPTISPLAMAYQEIPLLIQELIGGVYFERAALLGKRTAELHLALSSDAEDPAFAPEPFTALHQRSMFQSMQSQARRGLQLLRRRLKHLPDPAGPLAEGILESENEIFERLKAVLIEHRTGVRMRIHGDYHLGQVLFTGDDFILIDFEGEPARPLSERRLKRSPLRDIAGMLRSFHYAAFTGLQQHLALRPDDQSKLEHWIELWHRYVGGVFLRSYFERAQDALFLPQDAEEIDILLNAFLLHKAIYELVYELNSRPDWVTTPLRGIRSVLDIKGKASLIVEMQKAYPSGLPSP